MSDAAPFFVRKAAVLGAGVMGAQIAAHLVNASIEVLLYELPAEGTDARANSRKAISALTKLQPSPLASADLVNFINPATYSTDLELLAECDLVIEAIAERLDLKTALYQQVAPFLSDRGLLVSNTSGLSINRLAEALPKSLWPRFCGVHFFNPPRYMQLVELIPAEDTDSEVLDFLETFLVSTLGKGVVRAKDTPNFIANRIGVFSMLAALHHSERLGIAFDTVDALTGRVIGRAKSATFRTADVVGLDTFVHVVEGVAPLLKGDPWIEYYRAPAWLHALVKRGALGQKTREGIYKKVGKDIHVLDPGTGDYRLSGAQMSEAVQETLKIKDVTKRFATLREQDDEHSQFLWAIHRDLFHYAAVLLEQIADNTRDIDLGMRWGFGWAHGPFEIWQSAGCKKILEWINADIEAGLTMAPTPLPSWVSEVDGPYSKKGAWSPAATEFRPRSQLPVYHRQIYREPVLGEVATDDREVAYANDNGVTLWHRGDEIAILSFDSKMHTIGNEVMDGCLAAMDIAEKEFKGLVIWHLEPPFSLGADLKQFISVMKEGDFETLEAAAYKFQRVSLRFRYANIPVIAAVQGMALGGGCEFIMHCDHAVSALESYIGLVETGVGLIPGGGGCKELALRAYQLSVDGDLFPLLQKYFETVALAKTAASAKEAKSMGFLYRRDPIVFNPREILHVAKVLARASIESGYRPPLPMKIRVAGADGLATLQAGMVNMLEGGFISDHDYQIGQGLAKVMCGGEVDPGSMVDEEWLLALERQVFVDLCKTEKTQQRIEHTLWTGKPLRN
jgi:3-hydroxyacyl-CoA dehydrogenase